MFLAARKKKEDKQFVQFSKKLITAVMIFWGLIRLWSVIAVWLNPDTGSNMAGIVAGVDEIAMVNCLAYTSNSISEKLGLGYFKMKSGQIEEDDSNG